MQKKYTDTSIESISPREFTRLRPGVYAGSTEYTTQLLREIFSNALDEHTAGRGDEIIIEIDKVKNKYTVRDNGQGFPIRVMREDGESVLQAAFDVMNTSGKYHNDTNDSCYTGSIGTNGCGSKLTNFLSTELEVISNDGVNYEYISFKDGLFDSTIYGTVLESSSLSQIPQEWNTYLTHSGTTVTWTPDPQFFQHKEVELEELRKLFHSISALCPKLKIVLRIKGEDENVEITEEVFHCEHGLQDLVDQKLNGNLNNNNLTAEPTSPADPMDPAVKSNELISRFSISKTSGLNNENSLDLVLTYSSQSYSEDITAYVNYGLTEAGVHISTIKALFTKQMNNYARESHFFNAKSKEPPFSSTELCEGLILVFNLRTPVVSYDSQVKSRVVNVDRSVINLVFNNDFVDYLSSHPDDALAILNKAANARKVREAVQQAKDNARAKVKKNKELKSFDLPSKLIDAHPRDKDRTKCILYCVEGDSAANGLISQRDGEIHGIMPLKGKILSVYKAKIEDMRKNQEIQNIIQALGLDLDESTYTLTYDLNKLRYFQIVMLEDGDPDGGHIRMLLLALFWRLCPELVINGHVYTSRPPLYKITNKNKQNQYSYAVDDNELEKFKIKHKKESLIVNRLKG